jgi:hypothetical protein
MMMWPLPKSSTTVGFLMVVIVAMVGPPVSVLSCAGVRGADVSPYAVDELSTDPERR